MIGGPVPSTIAIAIPFRVVWDGTCWSGMAVLMHITGATSIYMLPLKGTVTLPARDPGLKCVLFSLRSLSAYPRGNRQFSMGLRLVAWWFPEYK